MKSCAQTLRQPAMLGSLFVAEALMQFSDLPLHAYGLSQRW